MKRIDSADAGSEPRRAWIGTEVVREADGHVVAAAGAWEGRTTIIENGVVAPGVLVLERYHGTDIWFVRGLVSPRDEHDRTRLNRRPLAPSPVDGTGHRCKTGPYGRP